MIRLFLELMELQGLNDLKVSDGTKKRPEAQLKGADEDEVELPDDEAKPVSRIGDLWGIGDHRQHRREWRLQGRQEPSSRAWEVSCLDGRKRERRKKGAKNLTTDFSEELASKVTMKVDGKPRRVTKQRAIMMRLMDSAGRGQNPAINTILSFAEELGVKVELEEPSSEELIEFPNLRNLTEYEFELPTPPIEKASGRLFSKCHLSSVYRSATKASGKGVDIRQRLAATLRKFRLEKGWSQDEFAHQADVHRTYIGDLERAARNPPTNVIDRLAVTLGVRAGQLVD